jgi:hypothetical protein
LRLRYAPAKCGKFDVSQCFFSILLPLSRNLTPSLCTIPHHACTNREGDSLFLPFCTIGIVYTKNVLYPILLFPLLSHPKLLPLWSVPDGQKILHPLLPKYFFFPLSARGPTRRRNSTGLAELWGGWPIELDPIWGYFCISDHNLILDCYGDTHH